VLKIDDDDASTISQHRVLEQGKITDTARIPALQVFERRLGG